MKELEYPFDGDLILQKAKRLKRELLAQDTPRLKKKIAMLGGSTTHDILRVLELFLLQEGIEPEFYESEYAAYWQDGMFPGEELSSFAPDLILVHTTRVNLPRTPRVTDTPEAAEEAYAESLSHFTSLWDSLEAHFHCPVIQNNFEYPPVRLLGNRDAVDPRGLTAFVSRMNAAFAAEAAKRESLYLCDINYLSARIGLDVWDDPVYWHMYKYALSMQAIPQLAYQYACLIRAIYGKNKKALVLDLDNTLWGGIVGDDGPDGLEIGQETSLGQLYHAFQGYVRAHRDLGVMLAVDSKNDPENALAGLNHPDGVLRPEDFVCIRANWEPKSRNFGEIAAQLGILPESMVFVDDNPAERLIVAQEYPGAAVPELGEPATYIRTLDHAAYFENITLSEDDLRRGEMMRENVLRRAAQESFTDYGEYLRSLQMTARIAPFEDLYYPRIAQLTNKSNQFNVTTKRYTVEEIRQAAEDPDRITLYGRLEDRFGDNGIVALTVGRIVTADDGVRELAIELFLMSCRVLKRDMEFAMRDALIDAALARGAGRITGTYLPTAKNRMVAELYEQFGFTRLSAEADGSTYWSLSLDPPPAKLNRYIMVECAG